MNSPFPAVDDYATTIQVSAACLRKLNGVLTEITDDALIQALIIPSCRRSNRARKQNITMLDQSHHDNYDPHYLSHTHHHDGRATSITMSPPLKKRKTAAARPLVTPPSPTCNPPYRQHGSGFLMALTPSGTVCPEKSLGALACRFRQYIQNQPDQIIDVKEAAEILQVERRRLYDVTNALEGAGLVEKVDPGVSCVHGTYRWIGPITHSTLSEQPRNLHNTPIVLIDPKIHQEQLQLDHWIKMLQSQTGFHQDKNITGSSVMCHRLYIHSTHLQQLLSPEETFLTIVPPLGSQLLNDLTHPHAVSIQLPTTSSSTTVTNTIPLVYLMEASKNTKIKLHFDEGVPLSPSAPRPPWLDRCTSDGWNLDSTMWSQHYRTTLDDKQHQYGEMMVMTPPGKRYHHQDIDNDDYDDDDCDHHQYWLQGISSPPLLRTTSSSAVVNVA